ncbi:hypothetical protein SNEBB_009128 [Seison nebaliae]|nr:hypothetical protein SNEBB_009128 [Seison nebaliae]
MGNSYGSDNFMTEAIKTHNEYRKKHGIDKLEHNNELDRLADGFAKEIAKSGQIYHGRTRYKNGQVGENIAMYFSPAGTELTGRLATDMWYREGAKHDYNEDHQNGTGHFTQVIWKSTREVGFGRAKADDGRWFFVAFYYPPGNILNRYRDNVLPLKK